VVPSRENEPGTTQRRTCDCGCDRNGASVWSAGFGNESSNRISRSTYEYGADYFGLDYDQKIYHWIESNYRVAGEFGRFRRDEIKRTLAALLYEKEDPGHGDRTR
jgi:hypothetical protein